MPSVQTHLAVDGGGTKTAVALVGKDGQFIAKGSSGACNFSRMTPKQWTDVIQAAIVDARKKIAMPIEVVQAWIGSAGIESGKQAQEAHQLASKFLNLEPHAVRVTNDAELLSANLRNSGIVVIAGTGSVVQAYTNGPQGPRCIARVGGLGWILGDEGSAYGIGRQALRVALSNEAPVLCNAILMHKSYDSSDALFRSIYSEPCNPQCIASLAPLIFSLALDANDQEAYAIIKEQAALLANQVYSLNSLFARPCDLCLGGSLFTQRTYRELLLETLRHKAMTFSHVHVADDVAVTAAQSLGK